MSNNQIKNSNFIILTEPLKTACCFCRTKTTDELKLGQVYSSNGLVVHYFCLLTASSLPQNGEDEDGILGFYLTDIRNELKVSATRTCVYCKKKGASVSCCTQKCKRWFHLTCGRKNDSLHQFFGRFKSFCSAHRPKQKVDKILLSLEESSSKILCPICYEDVVTESLDTLWAPCCKKNAWFHRDCVQRLALSAGYFFKCPLCNNEEVFKEAMEKFGIYIPQRDALWEQVPNAYQELLYQYRRCDAEECKCPRGRTHNGESNWELVRCKTCGSQGVHISCGRLKFSDPEWICRICKDVLKSEAVKRGASARSRSSSSSRSRSTSTTSRRSIPSVLFPQLADVDSQLSSNSESNDQSSQNQLRRSNGTCGRVSRSSPIIPPSSVDSIPRKPEVAPNTAVNNTPIKRCKPCPKRFKKDYVDHDETEEKSSKNESKTETPVESEADTSISLLKEYPVEEPSTNNIMVVESDSDEEIEVLEVHRVLERKSLTTGDGTTLEVHPIAEKKKVLYEIRDAEPGSSSGSAVPEVLTSPSQPLKDEPTSNSPTNSPPWRSLDPKLFYKPTASSTEKCDRLTEETSGSRQSVIIENVEAQMKSSGCQLNPVRSQPKTCSAAAEGKKSLMKPSVSVIPLTTNHSSNHDRIPVKSFPGTMSQQAEPVPLNIGVTNSVTQPSHRVVQPSHRATQPSHIEKPNPPARANVIEEITILDEPSQTAPIITNSNYPQVSATNHPQSFQPQIVNVRSCGNVPNNGPGPGLGPALISPMVPIVQQTGSILNTNKYIICTTGLWIPTSDSGYMAAPIMHPEPRATMSQPSPKSTMSFDQMETNLNIKISDVRHSNEFFNSPSNSINTPMNFRMSGEMAGWATLTLPQSFNGIAPLQGHQQNRVNLLGPPRLPTMSEISRGIHPPPPKPGQAYLNTETPRITQITPDRNRMMAPSSLLANRLSQSYGPPPTPERNSAPDVIVLE